MSDNALTMSLADIIKKGKQSRSPKPGRGGAKSTFRFGSKKQQNFPGKTRGRPGNGPGRGRGGIRGGINRNKVSQRGLVVNRGKGSIRGRNRNATGRIPNRGRQQFRRINNKINPNSPRKGQSGENSARLVQRAQRFTTGDQYPTNPTRYFKNVRKAWKPKGNFNNTARVTRKVRNDGASVNKGKRTVQKLAQKRIQKARLVLRSRNPVALGLNQSKGVQKLQGLSVVRKGIRRSKFGFVTVRSKNEKRIEQLSIQQKISRASQVRNRKSNGKQNWPENSVNVSGSTRPNRNRNKSRSQISMSNNLVQVRIPNDFRPKFEVQNTMPPQPLMYAGNSFGNAGYFDNMGGSGMNNMDMMYTSQMRHQPMRQGYGNPHEFEMDRGTLDPEIQRRISFIQSRTVGHSPSVIPDFKAPVSTSRMKLSDRFRMIMH